MCGISGYMDLGVGVDCNVLRRMNDTIRHRGPDDEGYALIGPSGISFYGGKDTDSSLSLFPCPDVVVSEAFIGFGHRRLSILDLSPSGHQPMYLPERDILVTYNGEIYNAPELRDELEQVGYEFMTSCDTEVLLKAYCQWGEECLNHLNGMWSFALWDGKENKLFCARDRLGAKPFHYWLQGNKFLFGSELKQLCQDDKIDRKFDKSYLAANLMYHVTDYNEQTLIEQMKVLMPGHKLIIKLSEDRSKILSFQTLAYWNLNVAYDDSVSEKEWEERVSEEFARSCRWRLRSDAPVAALLSGGLDSSCMVTELCKQLPDPSLLQTFTTSYPGDDSCDEWQFANMVNQACGCIGHQFLPNPCNQIERKFEDLVWHVEGHCNLALLGPKLLLEHLREQGFKVVLNGQCGDETMLGYERYYAFFFFDLLKKGKLSTLKKEIQLASKHSRYSFTSLAAMLLYFNFPFIRDTRMKRRASPFISKDLLDYRNKGELRNLVYPTSLSTMQKTELTATQLPHIVRYDDRIYMSASLESRIPFMDYQFVELATKIPPSMKIRNGYTKNLMRQIFDDQMPKEVTWRTNKMGFGAPTNEWAQKFPKDYLLNEIHTARIAPYLHMEALENMIQAGTFKQDFFELLSIELFAKQFDVR